MLNLNKGIVTSFLLGLVVHWSFGQSPTGDVDRAEWMRDQGGGPIVDTGTSNGVENGQAVSTPNDSDMGEQQILKRQTEYLPFTAAAGTTVFYTSNAALTHHGDRGDVVTAPLAAVYYEPKITNNLYAFADVRQQFFYYGNYHDLDFGSLDVEAGLSYSVPELDNLILRAEYDFNRLTSSDRVLDEFFSNHSLILNAEWPYRISRNQLLSLGTDANLSLGADHQFPRRNDYEVYAGYSIYLTRQFILSGAGRFTVRDYHQNDRTDESEILSISATYRLTPWWDVSAVSTFAHNNSNQESFDYNVANLGGSLAFSLKF